MKPHLRSLKDSVDVKRYMKTRRTRRMVSEFAEEYGLVYFGKVTKNDEGHRLVYGMTVSTHHVDRHYMIGTYEGYDVLFVERVDTVRSGLGQRTHRWHIFEFELLAAAHLPHIFVGMHNHSHSFYKQLSIKYPYLRPLSLDLISVHKADFTDKYRVLGNPSDMVEIESLISPVVSEMVSKHFGSLAVEIFGSSLYIYAENHALSHELLEAMIKNGRWLADHLDRMRS